MSTMWFKTCSTLPSNLTGTYWFLNSQSWYMLLYFTVTKTMTVPALVKKTQDQHSIWTLFMLPVFTEYKSAFTL